MCVQVCMCVCVLRGDMQGVEWLSFCSDEANSNFHTRLIPGTKTHSGTSTTLWLLRVEKPVKQALEPQPVQKLLTLLCLQKLISPGTCTVSTVLARWHGPDLLWGQGSPREMRRACVEGVICGREHRGASFTKLISLAIILSNEK